MWPIVSRLDFENSFRPPIYVNVCHKHQGTTQNSYLFGPTVTQLIETGLSLLELAQFFRNSSDFSFLVLYFWAERKKLRSTHITRLNGRSHLKNY